MDASCQGPRAGWGVAVTGTEFPCGVKEMSGIRQRWWLHNFGKILRKCQRTVHFKWLILCYMNFIHLNKKCRA